MIKKKYLIVQLKTKRNLLQQYILPHKFLSLIFIFSSLFIIILFIYNKINHYHFYNYNNINKYLIFHKKVQSYLPIAFDNYTKQLNRFYFNKTINKCVKFIYTFVFCFCFILYNF